MHVLISETVIFCYPYELLMDGAGCERSELQGFVVKGIVDHDVNFVNFYYFLKLFFYNISVFLFHL